MYISKMLVVCSRGLFPLIALMTPFCAIGDVHRAQGEMTGEVTMTTAIVQTRLTKYEKIVNGDVPGVHGFAMFEYSDDPSFRNSKKTSLLSADPENDHIVKSFIRGLRPGTRYYYRVHSGESKAKLKLGSTCSFRTLEGGTGTSPVSFVVVTGMNYESFHHVTPTDIGPRADRVEGFPALKTIADLKPDFFIGTGDNVYYDGRAFRARTVDEMRRKWREQFVQSRFVELFRNVPTYWEKDDHDHRYNDCDRVGNRKPSSDLGIVTFTEQVPIIDPDMPAAKTYRTHRVNKFVQLWLVEGRDYRSPNKMADGPEKTLWGVEQLAWLKSTILESDAKFKLLISPTPLVGPDDAYKIDNHTNHQGFRNEGREFFRWVQENKLHENGFYTICGDRHWQYHSRDPMGIEEFSCGALVDENSRLGRKPGDPKSTDPNAEIHQYYTQTKPSGGFLKVTVGLGPGGLRPDNSKAKAVFSFHDEFGKVLYESTQVR